MQGEGSAGGDVAEWGLPAGKRGGDRGLAGEPFKEVLLREGSDKCLIESLFILVIFFITLLKLSINYKS